MGWKLIFFVMCVYGWIAFTEASKGNWPLSIVFGGYAFSNIGLAYLAWKG